MAAWESAARGRSALQGEIDGIREAIRLNWVAMESSLPSAVERQAIRANVQSLVQKLTELLARSTPSSS
jgi:hypothetical protein